MQCPKCGYVVPYDPKRKDTHCTICNTAYKDNADDILLRGKYNLVSEIRPEQADMAHTIERLISSTEKSTFFAEGGTGIGKSFAYLIPALLSKKRILISTAKKTLQHQLIETDLPRLAKITYLDLRYGLFKGAANYGCIRCAGNIKNSAERKKFQSWCADNYHLHNPADVSKWPGRRPLWWSAVTVDNCPRKSLDLHTHCEYSNICRPHPGCWHVIVVNHSLLAVLLFVLPSTIVTKLIGDIDVLILDEAHQITNMFRSALSQTLAPLGFKQLRSRFINDDALHTELSHISEKRAHELLSSIKDGIDELHQHMLRYIPSDKTYARISQPSQLPTENLDKLSQDIRFLTTQLTKSSNHLEKSIPSRIQSEKERADVILSHFKRFTNALTRYSEFLEVLSSLKDNALITVDSKGLYTSPLDLSSRCGRALCAWAPHRILTSATMAIGTNPSFNYFRKNVGLLSSNSETPTAQDQRLGEVVEKIYKSPFDLHSQALLYTPPHLPIPAHAGTEHRKAWIQAISKEITRLLVLTQGNALVLFTAKTDLEEVYEKVQTSMPENLPILAQLQNTDTTYLKQKFDKTKNSSIFGTKSFFEGIDIAGNKLSLVVIVKLPFPNPKDPLIEALSEKSQNPYIEITQPQMLFDLKQAAGRLIRTKTDFGILAILDSRVWTGRKTPKDHKKDLRKISTARKEIRENPKKERKLKDFATYQSYGKLAVETIGFTNHTPSFTKVTKFVKQFIK